MLDKIANACNYLLHNYPDAQISKDYLDTRLSKESQEKWGFGYFPEIKNINVLTDLVSEDDLLNEKLLYKNSKMYNYFENHPLLMQQKDAYGNIIAFIGRTLLDEKTRKAKDIIKYKNTSFKKGCHLFGLYENKSNILEKDCVYIVEGQFDVIKATEKGLNNIVATGNSSLTAYQFSLIMRYTNNIFLLLDNDEAGEKGRKLIIKNYGSLANIRNFYVPMPYKDIDEYITKENIENYSDMSFVVKD